MARPVRLHRRSGLGRRRRLARESVLVVAGWVAVIAMATGCAGRDAGDGPRPKIEDFGPALDAVQTRYGSPQEFFEVSANLKSVAVVVARPSGTGDANTFSAESFSFADGTLSGPTVLGDAEGEVFTRDKIEIDQDRIFSGLRSELSDPVISDFAVTGAPGGEVIYDATVLSDKGGQLRVRVAADGKVLEVMAE